MLKLLCSVMALVFILSIFYSNPVKGRIINQNFEDVPASELHHLYFGNHRNVRDNGYYLEPDEYEHVKRKSDFLLSLYGLPYTLVNKREVE